MYEVRAAMPPHARITIREPRGGWSRPFYDRQIAQYVCDRGAAPRTVTLHPATMAALGFPASWRDAAANTPAADSLLVSSLDYPRTIITFYE